MPQQLESPLRALRVRGFPRTPNAAHVRRLPRKVDRFDILPRKANAYRYIQDMPVTSATGLYFPVCYLYDPDPMGTIESARQILAKTESSLRELIERALAEQQYGDVADIARIADAIARLLRNSDEDSPIAAEALPPSSRGEYNDGVASTPVVQETAASRATRKRRPAKGEYPLFERDGDKLIKIGWSKRDERVYEHRASRETVFLVSMALSSKVKPKAVFSMDQVLPLNDNGGHEIPSYQAYLALAWLRSIGTVQRRGKDGYSLTNGSLDSGKLQRLWNAIPSRH